MHIPDGFLDARTCAATFCVAGAGLALALRKVSARLQEKTVPLLGVMSAFVFAGQMINFPVAGGTSGHLMGGVLAAIFLGPSGAALVLATVLTVQCFLFQDGGLTALGANLLNLGLIGVLGGYAVYRVLTVFLAGDKGRVLAAAVASWFSIMVAAAACAFELAAAETISVRVALPAMLVVHSVIGIGEALITASVVSFVLKVRPDLVYSPSPLPAREPLAPAIVCGFISVTGLLVLLAPFTSSLPDGLEFVAGRFHVDEAKPVLAAPLPEYMLPWVPGAWVGQSLAAAGGVAVTFGLARVIGRLLRRARTEPNDL